MKKGLLLVISGPSGCGKGTICKEFLKRNDADISISATTRKPRIGEVDRKDYFFINMNEFKSMIENEDFLEYACVHGNYYGTPKKFVMEKLESGRDVLLEIDIQGALQIKRKFKDGIYIFILPPSMEELKKRIIKRGTETEESIKQRYENAYKELKYICEYEYAVVNDEVEKAVKKIEAIFLAEKCKVERQKDIIKNI